MLSMDYDATFCLLILASVLGRQYLLSSHSVDGAFAVVRLSFPLCTVIPRRCAMSSHEGVYQLLYILERNTNQISAV